jgi:tetratricopeptide (TPR) repeat protein
MVIWATELKEIEKLNESLGGKFPEVGKELVNLIRTDDENVALLYSRRCLEIIITDLCECELKRSRGSEPLKGIIDKLHKEEKVPSNIIASMLGLNTLSTFGTHPKDFDPEQVKPVLSNLLIIEKWYLRYKDPVSFNKLVADEKQRVAESADIKEKVIIRPKKRLLLPLSSFLLAIILAVIILAIFDVINFGILKKVDKSIAVLPFDNLSNDPDQEYFSVGMVDEILDRLFKIGDLKVIARTSSARFKNTNLSLKEIAHELGVAAITIVWASRQQMGLVKVSEAAPKSEAAIMKAIELDSTQSDIHSALAAIKVWTRWDWKGGEASFKKAIELNPNNAGAHNAYSHLLNILGRPDEAMKQIAIALELDPLNPQVKAFYGIDLMFIHRFDDAIKAFQEALELSPGHDVAHTNIVLALYFAGRENEAMETWRKDFNDPEVLKVLDEGYKEGGYTGMCMKLADFLSEIAKNVYINPAVMGELYALAGDIDNSMYWLEKAYEEHEPNMPYLLFPSYDKLREDARFQNLCRRMNLTYKQDQNI